ncbi:MAG: carboxylating nicotinate-nucleotide diphosphorylase, partial [Deltaproteobacteria bacterium]|nr:carboxylating nicotinate-nucleotide diphosphorylase [Deltaproteobacteria bacterium]
MNALSSKLAGDFPIFAADRVIRTALEEDIGDGDVTTLATVPAGAETKAFVWAKEDLRVAGLPAFVRVFERLAPTADFHWKFLVREGDDVARGTHILECRGEARILLVGERTALNLLQRLSGIATMTARWTELLRGTKAMLIDTRKTSPGLRALEKYAVRAGGGRNHRAGLYDGVLIKENHIRACGGIKKAVQRTRLRVPHTLKIEVEVTNLTELEEALSAGADIILLDNMGLTTMGEAV